MQWLRAIGSLTILVGVLVGVPFLLLLLGSPLSLLDVDWGSALQRPDDGRILLGILSVIGWITWAVLAVTTLAELISVLSRRRVEIRIPGTGWLRPVIGSLVAAATLAPGTLAAAVPPPAAPVAAGVVPSAPPVAPDHQPASTGRVHVVQPGDELWSVAEAHLGSGERWRDILTVNPGMSASTRLVPGSEIQLPPDVVVTRGDSLWSLAAVHLHDPQRWQEIHELNSDLIHDPDHIEAGWRLLLPDVRIVGPASPAPDLDVAPSPKPPMPNVPEVAPPPVETVEPPPADLPHPGVPTPAAATASPTVTSETPETASEQVANPADDEAGRVLGPIGGLLASSIIVGVAARRRLQLVSRAVGRRLVPFAPDSARFWTALARRADDEPTAPGGQPPATVVLGWRVDETDVLHDLEAARLTTITGTDDDVQAMVGAMVTSLACAPWSADVEIVVVGADQPWAETLDDPRVTSLQTLEEGITHCTKVSARRRLSLGTQLLDEARSDPDKAPAYQPAIYLFATPPTPRQRAQVDEALAFGRVGVGVVIPGDGGSTIRIDDDRATLDDITFRPQLITAPARRALVELFDASGSDDSEAAPWFAARGASDSHSHAADPRVDAPYLVLLGEPDLLDAGGTPPPRARQQCVEYCAWMTLHPGARSSTMQHALVIAEGTRRSNLSRLRKWLGSDGDGNEYLPDAYDGRLHLDSRITTDWQVLLHLIGDGVEGASDAALRQALTLVQGPPLGTAVHRWSWARTLHDDMTAAIVDIACHLADRALEHGDSDTALWALSQAELAAPGHDEVAIRLILAHSRVDDAAGTDTCTAKYLDQIKQDNRDARADHLETLAKARSRLRSSASGGGEENQAGSRSRMTSSTFGNSNG